MICSPHIIFKDICWHHKQCTHTSNHLLLGQKTEKPTSAPRTPAKRKNSKPTNSLRAQIKDARDKKSASANEIGIKIDAPEETAKVDNTEEGNKENVIDSGSDDTSTIEGIPKLPERQKPSKN